MQMRHCPQRATVGLTTLPIPRRTTGWHLLSVDASRLSLLHGWATVADLHRCRFATLNKQNYHFLWTSTHLSLFHLVFSTWFRPLTWLGYLPARCATLHQLYISSKVQYLKLLHLSTHDKTLSALSTPPSQEFVLLPYGLLSCTLSYLLILSCQFDSTSLLGRFLLHRYALTSPH